jgi:hypothetical protein
LNGRSAARQRGEKGGRGWGVRSWECYAALGVSWGLAPTGGRCPAVAQNKEGGADTWARVGRPEKERRLATEMNSKVLYLFELV